MSRVVFHGVKNSQKFTVYQHERRAHKRRLRKHVENKTEYIYIEVVQPRQPDDDNIQLTKLKKGDPTRKPHTAERTYKEFLYRDNKTTHIISQFFAPKLHLKNENMKKKYPQISK